MSGRFSRAQATVPFAGRAQINPATPVQPVGAGGGAVVQPSFRELPVETEPVGRRLDVGNNRQSSPAFRASPSSDTGAHDSSSLIG
jgi:hypothetical protein